MAGKLPGAALTEAGESLLSFHGLLHWSCVVAFFTETRDTDELVHLLINVDSSPAAETG